MKRKTILKHGRGVAQAACALLIGTSALQSCKDDVLTGQPDWLGNSIYERLQEEGKYSTTLRLIDDLDMREVLGHTGSKTLFVADDDAYRQWYQQNDWGVHSYEQLSVAQKKLLLNNSMINNAYLIELMSNVSGTPPVEGMAMRRETATSIYDSVYVMHYSTMPNTNVWKSYIERQKSIPIFKDATSAPMIHFLPAYMTFNKITSEDLTILTNGQATSANEAWVNGKKVVERDITCKNGYIQKVNGVIESSPNMAEILRQHPQMSMWSHLVDRFSAPYYNAAGTREYNRIYNNEDSVFTLRYFSKRSSGSALSTDVNFDRLPGEEHAHEMLKFDPGWNHFVYKNSMDYDLHYDAGAMIVPTNEALEAWWNDGGKDLHDEYKEWDSIPDATIQKLINVNMLDVFSASVPSKFGTILNDAKEALGITKADVDSCFMGCNGVVYMVNKVFTPAEYASVAYPALAHQSTMNVIYWAIDELNFLPYLLSMDSRYALMLPNNEAMLMYLDPASYGRTDGDFEAPQLIEFKYDRTKSLDQRVQASRYSTTVDAEGNITKGLRLQETMARNVINTMLTDMLDQLIIVLPDKTKTIEDYVADGYSLFKTKGGSLVRVTNVGGKMAFEGGWQMEHNKPLVAAEMFNKENGRSYLLNTQMPLASQKSLYMTLKEHDEYTAFLKLLENDYSDLLSLKLNNKYNPANSSQNNKNLRLFDNYNYTVFIPSTTAIEQLQAQKLLPSWDEMQIAYPDPDAHHDYESVLDSICKAEGWYDLTRANGDSLSRDVIQAEVQAAISSVITNFVRYHVMDRSVAVGMAPEANSAGDSYESMMRNPETGRFFPLEVHFDQNSLTVKDVLGKEQTIQHRDGLYNNICREYWFEGSGNSARLYMGSSAVAHLIDQPLYYKEMKPWRQAVIDYVKNN